MCCQFPRKGHGQEHLASSFHRFSSRSTQQQLPDTFTFGPTQSDSKYSHNNGLQERFGLSTSQGSETPGSSRGGNSLRAALKHSQEGLGSAFSRHQLLSDTPWLTPGSSSGISKSRVWRCHTCPRCHKTGAGQRPGTPSPFGGSFGEIFLWVVAPFICKHVCKPMTDLDYPWNC